MVTAVKPNIASRAHAPSDHAPELTLDALMARMRNAAERSALRTAAVHMENRAADGEPATPAALLRAQADFNQALVDALTFIVQHLRQSRTADKSPAAINMQTAGLTLPMDAMAAQIQDLAQRLDHAVATLTAAEQHQLTLVNAIGQRLHEIEQRLDAVGERHDALDHSTATSQQQTAAQFQHHQQQIAGYQAAIQQLREEFAAARCRAEDRLVEMELRLWRAEKDTRNRANRTVTPTAPGIATASSQTVIDPSLHQSLVHTRGSDSWPAASNAPEMLFDYFLFEQRFRGPTEEIKHRQHAYLDYFLSAASVLDLGCGRGEFLQLLAEHGVPVIGVDSNEDMVDFCRARGLPVVQGDLFGYLAEQIDGSVDGIFVAQVVEHLPPDQVWKLIQLATAKLKPDGVLLLETINPQCFPAMNWFYLDPTHVRLYPPALLSFMCEQAHFRLDSVQFSAPLPGATDRAVLKCCQSTPPEEASQYQDFAIIARRLPG